MTLHITRSHLPTFYCTLQTALHFSPCIVQVHHPVLLHRPAHRQLPAEEALPHHGTPGARRHHERGEDTTGLSPNPHFLLYTFLDQDELEHFSRLETKTTANKWFLPLVWAGNMVLHCCTFWPKQAITC